MAHPGHTVLKREHDVRVVVYDENLCTHGPLSRLVCSRQAATIYAQSVLLKIANHASSLSGLCVQGSRKETCVPVAGLLSTQMRPPCMMIKLLVINKPSRAPWEVGIVEGTLENSSKIFVKCSGAIPQPVSLMHTRIMSPSVTSTVTVMAPRGGVNFTALPIRFHKTCSSLSRSP